ncbi:MAG: hemolysin III family protein [Clostridiales bacterium]|nr:hemolysin III family protein [Clostridiales bacterium]
MIRTPLSQRTLPAYTRGQEIANMITHIVGAALGFLVLIGVVWQSARTGSYMALITGSIYALTMIGLYAISSIYHGLLPSMGKKVMQVLDHCSIYCLIAATYTPIALVAVHPRYPVIGLVILLLQWLIAAVCIVFSAIDLRRFRILEMASYILMGWMAVLFMKPVVHSVGRNNFMWILMGGVVFTVGSILYNLGKKKNPGYHVVFHVFCLMGSALQAVAVCRICGGMFV